VSVSAQAPVQEKKRVKKRWFAYFGANTLALSILLHILFAIGAAYLVVEHFAPKHINFHATEPPSAHTEVEHKVQLAKRNNVESAPPDLKRIVTRDVSAITLPDPPDIPTTDEASPSPMAGVDGVMGSSIMGGGDPGGNGPPGGDMTVYGAPSGLGLTGNLYDLKQGPDGTPTDLAETDAEKQVGPNNTVANFLTTPPFPRFLEVLQDFIKTWDLSKLDRYYKSPVALSIPQFCIPDQPSDQAPKAFQAPNVVARRWIAVYHAKVMPPDSGEYRFIGLGDDFLVVRVDDRNVLDGCWGGEELDPSIRSNEDVGQGFQATPLSAGKWFQVEEGTPIDIQVLIGEGPGGYSGFLLMIQKQGDDSPKGDYPVFQVLDTSVPDMGIANFSRKKALFPVVEEQNGLQFTP